jgi:hypothetical protein
LRLACGICLGGGTGSHRGLLVLTRHGVGSTFVRAQPVGARAQLVGRLTGVRTRDRVAAVRLLACLRPGML